MTERPVNDDAIPDELIERDQWLLWGSTDPDAPRQPHWCGDYSISWSDPADWHSFEEALEAAQEHEAWGVGYVTARDNDAFPRGVYGVIDIDGGVGEGGELKDWVPALDRFADAMTYMEYSPSGDGIHIPFVGEVPDWWTDGQFGDHEGVDVLTNKFCTFTGDQLPTSGGAVADVDPTPWLLEAYHAVHGEYPFLDSGEDPATDHDYDGGEWLTDELVAEALSTIDPDVGYETWRDLGFAVHDYDPGPTGRRLFEDWSQDGHKYDDDAERYIEAIWERADQGSGITVATLVHTAQQHGWRPGQDRARGQASAPDEDEMDRAAAILDAQTGVTDPAGELTHQDGCYGIPWAYTDDDGTVTQSGVDTVCNFTLETVSFLQTDRGTDIVLRVHPSSPTEEAYETRVQPEVFNSADAFRTQVVTGRTTWFDPSNREHVPTMTILRYLRETVGEQPAPHRTGTPHIGLSPDGSEYVTPEGSLTADGWAGDPDFEFYTQGGAADEQGALAQKWALAATDDADYDGARVGRICELLPQLRQHERGLPILGWFYAAPLKAYIHEWEHEFPILSPFGDTGSGKTTTLETFTKAFGATGEPLSSTDTPFTIQKHLAESRGLPVWIDEYKPTEIPDGKLDHLHQRLKEVTKERSMPKGRPDLGVDMLWMRAPVVVSGEQKIADPPVRRRSIMTNLAREPTRDGTPTKAAFGELVGIDYESPTGEQCQPEGYDLTEHALAYYQWVMERSERELRETWHEARRQVKQYLQDAGITLEESEHRGLQTLWFGCRLHREFATAHGADADALPTDREIRDACAHVVDNIGKDGHRREHADDFLELLSLAATENYIEAGVHYRLVDSQKWECEALAVHMPSAFTAVKKYLREYNLEDEYTILAKTDYLDSFRNKAAVDGEYVLGVNQRVRNLENGSKAVYFDPEVITATLGEDFNETVFRVDTAPENEDGAEADESSVDALAALPLGHHSEVVAEVAAVSAGEYSREAQGTLVGPHGTYVSFVIPGGNENPLADAQGETFRFENIRLRTDSDGLREVVINDAVTITPLDDSQLVGLDTSTAEVTDPATADSTPASDGGTAPESDPPTDATGPRANAERARETLRDLGTASKLELVAQLGDRYEMAPKTAERAIQYAREETTPALIIGSDEELEPT